MQRGRSDAGVRDRWALVARVAPWLTLAAILLAWEVAVEALRIPIYLMPAPTDVAGALVRHARLLFDDARITLWEVLVSFVTCLAVGIPLGVAAVKSRLFRATVYPLLVASQSVPVLAAAPLLIVWFGYGIAPKIIVAFLIAFFPIVVGTAVGLRSVPADSLLLARSMGLGRRRTFLKIELPAALPSIFGGLKIASAVVIVGAVVSEFVSSSGGLGHRVLVSTGNLETPLLIASLVAMIVMGLALFGLVALVERVAIPWRKT